MEVGYFRGSPEDFLKGHFLNAPQKLCEGMDSPEFSLLSSMRGEFRSELYVQPHYKEAYRLAIDRLVEEGRDAYHDVLKTERIGNILSDDEIFFITTNAEQLVPQASTEENNCPADKQSSSGTYWPVKSDAEPPNLELGWPDFLDEKIPTKIDLHFHPPRPNNPTIKEVIRKHIQDAKQVIAIVMDTFTDVDIFKEAVDASIHGVAVYVLLDHSHLKSFLSMAESLDVKVQQLRHMRVRTVKGQDYLCRSGAKFHGALEQKFLLVDCHTAIYGSYSYTWSFEKINESMVQVIRGHLVKSYDEEFRVLYAKSTVPSELTPLEGWSLQNDFSGQPILTKLSGRHDQFRHSLDTAYQRTSERKFRMRDLEDRSFEKENNIWNGITVHGHKPQFPYFDSEDSMNYNKRHSYAGEKGDGYQSQNLKLRGSNLNVSRDDKNSQIKHSMNNYLQVPQNYRGQSMKQVPFTQQNKSPLLNVSKSLMETWRVETYLNNSDTTFAEPCDYLDQFGAIDEGSSFVQGRMRNSLALGSALPEQVGLPRFTNTSRGVGPLATPETYLHYSSKKWNPEEAEKRINSEDFMKKQQRQQIIDDFNPNSGFVPGKNSYTSLGRTQRILTSPEYLTDNWYKRHSVADPRSNTESACESLDEMYSAFQETPVNRSSAAINTPSGGYRSSLKEDQRSVSHYDVKSVTNTKSSNSQIWKEPLSRALSAAALEHKSKNAIDRPNTASSPEKKRTWKIKSLLNIPEKKEDPVDSMKTPSVTSGDSTDTLTAEEEERISCRGKNFHQKDKDSENHKDIREEDNPKFSKPRFVTEENQQPSQKSFHKTAAAKKSSAPDRSLRPGSENRLYSRFEPFCSLEKKVPNSLGKSKSFSKADVEHSAIRATKVQHENKLGKLFHRMGSLLHKNK